MNQIARNLTHSPDGLLTCKLYLIHDSRPIVHPLRTLKDAGVEAVKLPPRSPNLKGYAERFVRSMRRLPGTTDPVRRVFIADAVRDFVARYHRERHHQGLSNVLISPESDHVSNRGAVRRRERLGGMLNYYYRAAA